MHSWGSFTPAEQTLLRRAMSDSWLAGTVQVYGVDLRWAGADGRPHPAAIPSTSSACWCRCSPR